MTVLAIAWNDLKIVLGSKVALFWIFVGPVLFAAFFGLIMKPSPQRATVLRIVNRDTDGRVQTALAEILRRDGIAVESGEETAPGRWVLEIPEGAADGLAAGKPVTLRIHSPEREETNTERRIRFRVEKALITAYFQANPSDLAGSDLAQEVERRLNEARAITIRRGEIRVERAEITTGFQRTVPAYLVMFVFMQLLGSGAELAEDRASGRMRRLFMAPVSKRQIIAGKLLSRTAVGWMETVNMLLVGLLVFKIRWAEHPWAFAAFLTLFAVASASIGLLLGTLFRDPDRCRAAAVWTAVLLAPLGGLWWPLEVVGPTMRKIGYFVPTGWAMEGMNAMLAFGAGAREVAPFSLAFAAVAAVSLSVAARRLRA